MVTCTSAQCDKGPLIIVADHSSLIERRKWYQGSVDIFVFACCGTIATTIGMGIMDIVEKI